MRLCLRFLFAIVATVVLVPSAAFACECLSGGSPSGWRTAAYVFIGTATTRSNAETRIVVDRQFRGPELKDVRVPRDPDIVMDDCEFVLTQGTPYLIRSETRDIRRFSVCNPPVPVAEASEELKYFEGALAKTPLAFLYGFIREHKPNGDLDTVPAVPITVVVDVGQVTVLRQPIRRFPSPPNKLNFYQFVVPPGSHRIWLERNGSRLADPQVVHVADGQDVQLDLAYSLAP